jgi:hypothetical protein
VARDLIAFQDGVYQVLDLPAVPKTMSSWTVMKDHTKTQIELVSSRYELGSNRLSEGFRMGFERDDALLVRHAHSDVAPLEDSSISAADQSPRARKQQGE